MDVSSNRIANFEVGNTLQPEPQLKSNNLTILQRTAMVVALAALAAIVPSALAGSFVATVICATVIIAAGAVVAVVATILYKQSKQPKQDIAAPSKPASPVAPAEEAPKPDTALQFAPNEKPLPLLLLPNEVLANLCTFLPLKALGHLALINKKFADFLGSGTVSGQHAWKLIANKLGALLISPSKLTPKEQVKNLFIEYPECTVDLLNNKLILKDCGRYPESIFETIFTRIFPGHVPKGYYLKCYCGLETDCILYREGDEIKGLTTPGGLEKKSWGPGELELYNSIIETYKCFEVIEVESPIARDNIPS